MRLLSRREIDSLKAQERQKEVQEGVKLAKRVDTLRELHAEEEKSLDDYRTKTVASIHKEIETLGKQRDELQWEVIKLERRKKEALEPLVEETNALIKAKEELVHIQHDLNVAQLQLKEKEKNVEKLNKQAQEEHARAVAEKKRADALLLEADTVRQSAESLRKESQSIKSILETERKVHTKSIHDKEQELAVLEKNLSLKHESVDKKEQQLVQLEKRLIDREATLARNIKRYGSTSSIPKG